VPGHKKALPWPCPQCGQGNGGIQFVFFNHRYYKIRTGYARTTPYHLLRISHYSKGEYKLKKHRPTKIWHTFRFKSDVKINYGSGRDAEVISINELFDKPDYLDKESVTLKIAPSIIERVKKYGWQKVLSIVNEGAHWFRKDGPKKCQKCGKIVPSLNRALIWSEEQEEYPRWVYGYYIWLCERCYTSKETKRIAPKQMPVKSIITI
jgi:hypothetical protein